MKSKKSALLMSFTSLLICFAMLVGSTFAWFTDTATTGVNKIVSGKLKVDLVAAEKDPDDKYPSLTGKDGKLLWTQKVVSGSNETLKAVETEGQPLWEPGVNFLTQGFKIANKGNLALKWKVEVNKGTTAANAGDYDLLDVIDFSVVTKSENGDQKATELAAFEGQLKEENSVSAETYYIKGHMQEEAGNNYQSLTLDGITITVYATQDTVESDSYDNQYDKYAQFGERTVKNEAPVVGTNGTYGLVDSGRDNINTKNVTYSIPTGNYDGGFYTQHFGINSTFDGNGSTFKSFQLNCGYVPTTEESTLVVSNLNVNGDLIITASSNNVIINNCNAQHISVLKISDDTKVIIDGCTVSGVGMDNLSGNNKYGIYITRNSNGGTADVEIINSNISNIKASAIVVNGGTDTSQTATNFTIKGNTFSKYGLDGKLDNKRAAFLIYNDTVLAPTSQQNETVKTMTEAAEALGTSIKNDNTFVSANIPETAVIANFFFATVDFD